MNETKDESVENASKAEEVTPKELSPLEQLQQENTELVAKLDESQKETLYLRAEFDNFRKNTLKERSDLIKYGPEKFIVKLLEVLDNFDRALEMEPNSDNIKSFKEGFELTSSQLYKLLDDFGVKKVNPQNEKFDPKVHEALGSEPTTELAPGNILRVFKSAYQFYDKTVRPAQVIVSAEPPADKKTDA